MARMNKVGRVATDVVGNNESGLVKYHRTYVVNWNKSGITLNSDGWQTATTKLRMNQASNQFDLGFQVYQKDFAWFVDYNGETIPYRDNMFLERK